MSANLRQANTRAWERCMRKKHNRSKESDSRLSPVVAGKNMALCLGRDCDYPKELWNHGTSLTSIPSFWGLLSPLGVTCPLSWAPLELW